MYNIKLKKGDLRGTALVMNEAYLDFLSKSLMLDEDFHIQVETEEQEQREATKELL